MKSTLTWYVKIPQWHRRGSKAGKTMSIKEHVENDLGFAVSQTDIDAYIPQAQNKICRAKVDDNIKTAYLAILVAELIRADMFTALCLERCRSIRAKEKEHD